MHHVIEDISHGSLICGTNILEYEGHDFVIVIPLGYGKCSIILILRDNISYHVVLSTRVFMLGNGKSSLG